MKNIIHYLKLVSFIYFFFLLFGCNNDEVIIQPEAKNINLLFPQGGEVFSINDTIHIIWENNTFESVEIEFSSNLGNQWTKIADSLPSNIKIYFWKTPNLISSNCIIKISTLSASDSLAVPFSINVPGYKLKNLNYYPLKIGNQWIYKRTGLQDAYFYSTIVGDTMINERMYFIFDNQILTTSYYSYERVDTLTGNIIRFDVNQERILDNLYAKIGDKIACLRYGGSLDSTLFEREETIYLWGASRNTRTYFNDGLPDRFRYSLVNRIGLFAAKRYIHPVGYLNDTLNACRVNGVIYGDTTLIR
jgi:hypothetical protein